MYRIRILDAATRELARLDKPVGRRVVERIRSATAERFIGGDRKQSFAGIYSRVCQISRPINT